MQEGKSKRDLIWEQKKRAREALLQNGNLNHPLLIFLNFCFGRRSRQSEYPRKS